MHLFLGNYEKSENYYSAALKIFQSIKNDIGISSCYNNLGFTLELRGEFEKAMDYYSKSLKIDEKIDNRNGIAASLTNIGNVLQKQGNYKSSIEYYIKVLRIREETKDKTGIADAYNNIGALYQKQEAYNEAIKNYQNALVLYIEINEKLKSAIALHNIGSVLDLKKQYATALEYYNQALDIRENYGDKSGIASTLLNITNINLQQNEYSLAFKNLSRSQLIYKEIGNKHGVLNTEIVLAEYSLRINNPTRTISILESIVHENSIQPEQVNQIYKILSQAYFEVGRFLEAYNNKSKYIELKDSLENEENTKKILQIQLNYEFDKKQKELEIEQEKQRLNDFPELHKRKLIILILIICLVAFLLIGILIYRSYRIKKKDNYILELQKRKIEENNEELTTYQEELISQKENLEVQQKLVTKQRDQITEQKEKITDSIQYAKRIQNSMLPPEELFQLAFREYFILYQPKDIVSGDFYWFKETKNHIFLAVADCTGHGVPGAFMSLLGISFLNEIVESGIIRSSHILNKTRERLKTTLRQQLKSNEPRDGMDIGLCVINKKNKELQFSGAYNSLIILRNSNNEEVELIEFKGDKMPIGSHFKDEKDFTTQKLKIEPDDKFYLFTDGLIDQFGGVHNRKFLPNRFRTLLSESQNEKMTEQKKILIKRLEKWMDEREQIDDILVVGFCF